MPENKRESTSTQVKIQTVEILHLTQAVEGCTAAVNAQSERLREVEKAVAVRAKDCTDHGKRIKALEDMTAGNLKRWKYGTISILVGLAAAGAHQVAAKLMSWILLVPLVCGLLITAGCASTRQETSATDTRETITARGSLSLPGGEALPIDVTIQRDKSQKTTSESEEKTTIDSAAIGRAAGIAARAAINSQTGGMGGGLLDLLGKAGAGVGGAGILGLLLNHFMAEKRKKKRDESKTN